MLRRKVCLPLCPVSLLVDVSYVPGMSIMLSYEGNQAAIPEGPVNPVFTRFTVRQ